MGLVIWDHLGYAIRAGAGRCAYLMDAYDSGVVGCREGVRAAEGMCMQHVVIETDSMLLKMALESNSFALAPIGRLLYDIKCMLNDSFSSWRCSFCPRKCNKVAHAVTAQGCKYPHGTVLSWIDRPLGVEDLVPRDCSSSPV
jgi:hypothetical protein